VGSGIRVAGIDGTKGGWVGVVLEDGVFAGDHLVQPVEARFDDLVDAQVLAIDVPIGFGPREADAAARRFLTGAASTVFTTPKREILEMPFGPGLGVSAQAHALGRRILHVTQLAQADSRLYEVHPEVSFRAMNGGRPLRYRKKSAGGVLERLELLRQHGIELAKLRESASVPLDDVLDAAAAAWSAQRIAMTAARTLPDPPEVVDGRSVAIWY
jgi:predicted RNase H-like nuclease